MPLADLLARRRAGSPAPVPPVPPRLPHEGTGKTQQYQGGSPGSPGSPKKTRGAGENHDALADDLARRANRAAEVVAAMEVDEGERAAIAHHAGGIPAEWCDGWARLQVMPCPDGMPEARWARLIDDAGRFLDRWAARASALGWGTLDVWGCHPSAPRARVDCLGLVGLLDGTEVVAITTDTATVRTRTGARQTVRRRPMPGAAPVWTLAPDAGT
jgi:hypothetical protein